MHHGICQREAYPLWNTYPLDTPWDTLPLRYPSPSATDVWRSSLERSYPPLLTSGSHPWRPVQSCPPSDI